MRRLATIAALAATLTAGAAAAQDAPSLLVMVTSPDPQVQLMSMVLTAQATRQGANARVLLCGAAGDIALKDAPESATAGQPPRDMSPQGLMRRAMETGGVEVEVCAIYLPGAGLSPDALLDEVTAADPAAIGALLVDPGTEIVTF